MQPPNRDHQANTRPREATGTGRFSPKTPTNGNLPDQPPAWVEMQPSETLEEWKDRIYHHFLQYQLNQGFRETIVGLKRHELAAKQLWPIKQELDITARQDDWLRHLTDEELLVLKGMRDRALSRNSAIPLPSDSISDAVGAEGGGHE